MAAMCLFWQGHIRKAQTRFLYCAWVQKYYTKYIRPCQKRPASAIIPPLPRLVNIVHSATKNRVLRGIHPRFCAPVECRSHVHVAIDGPRHGGHFVLTSLCDPYYNIFEIRCSYRRHKSRIVLSFFLPLKELQWKNAIFKVEINYTS